MQIFYYWLSAVVLCFSQCSHRCYGAARLVAGGVRRQRSSSPPAAPPRLLLLLIPPAAGPVCPAAAPAAATASHRAHAAAFFRTGRPSNYFSSFGVSFCLRKNAVCEPQAGKIRKWGSLPNFIFLLWVLTIGLCRCDGISLSTDCLIIH